MIKLLGHGAEAKVYLVEGKHSENKYIFSIPREITGISILLIYDKQKIIVKYRYPKKYRHPLIDYRFRKYRTRREAKILKKLANKILVPEVIAVDEDNGILIMEYIEGIKLADVLEKLEYNKIMYEVGKIIATMHNENIAHFDLTTSNILYTQEENLYLIDFGLSEFTKRIEDFAVDLHLMKEALESKHWRISEEAWNSFLDGYKTVKRDYNIILKRLEKVEQRGRYKAVT